MGKIELPTVIISIIENYAHEFEKAEMLEYAIQKIINRLDRKTGYPIYLWSVRSEIRRVERELKTIYSKEKTNEKARLKARIRPVTYKRHLRFLKKDQMCDKRMGLLANTITLLQKSYSTWVDFNDDGQRPAIECGAETHVAGYTVTFTNKNAYLDSAGNVVHNIGELNTYEANLVAASPELNSPY